MAYITKRELAEIDAMVWPPEPEPLVTTTELAEFLGTTPARISALATAGILPRDDLKRFPLAPATRAYIAHVRAKPSTSTLAANPELNREKVRLARANAEKAEAANARARGELAALSDVEREWAGILRDVRAALLALPSRAAARLGHLTPQEVAILDREVRAVLEELASHD